MQGRLGYGVLEMLTDLGDWTKKEDPRWATPNAHYFRSASGGGKWEFYDLPEVWQIGYGPLTFHLKPFAFKHTGLFPEQAVNWDFIMDKIKNLHCIYLRTGRKGESKVTQRVTFVIIDYRIRKVNCISGIRFQ